jgi:hypothetical protein
MPYHDVLISQEGLAQPRDRFRLILFCGCTAAVCSQTQLPTIETALHLQDKKCISCRLIRSPWGPQLAYWPCALPRIRDPSVPA